MPRERTIPCLKAFPLLGLVGTLLVLGSCGSNKPDLAKGKQLFVQSCGSCHQLAEADTRGTIGPNLDDSFRQAIADGLGRDTVEGVVEEQIAFPQGGQMPANLVKGDDREDVAAYVARVAGKRPSGSTGPSGGEPGGTAKANSKNEVEIPTDETGQLLFKFKSATAKAGKVTLLSKNDSPVPHDISVKDGSVDESGNQVTVDIEPGKYTFYCSVPGHEQAGMRGTLTVR